MLRPSLAPDLPIAARWTPLSQAHVPSDNIVVLGNPIATLSDLP